MAKLHRKPRKPFVGTGLISVCRFIYRTVDFLYKAAKAWEFIQRVVEFFQDFDWPPFFF